MSRGRPKGSTKKPDVKPELTLHEKAARYDSIIEQARARRGYVAPPKTEFERGMRALTYILSMPTEQIEELLDRLKRQLNK